MRGPTEPRQPLLSIRYSVNLAAMTPQTGIYQHLLQWLQQHLLTCPFKAAFHFDCPGCGFQRSLLALLRGDLYGSLRLYPAALPIVLMMGFLVAHLKFKFRFGAEILKFSYIFITVIIVVSYLVKLKNYHFI